MRGIFLFVESNIADEIFWGDWNVLMVRKWIYLDRKNHIGQSGSKASFSEKKLPRNEEAVIRCRKGK